ncbi:MAG: HAD-IC family P-type ATPase [Candidatus Methylomirabilis sp.]|nr:HAD-IC family P-type ATPase [Candidatus Methylomirabilis sp.]
MIAAVQFRVDNAPLTGESIAKSRTSDAATAKSLVESPNVVFAGTTVLSGTARAVVFATGMNTEFGKIAHLTSGIEAELSPLQQEIRKVTRLIAAISIGIGFAFFGLGVLIGRSFWENFVFAVGLLVANVPEGLLPTVTLALAVGAQRMAKRKALMRNLASVETLGCATVICTDKTGTLTENRMAVTRLYIDGREFRVSGRAVTTETGTAVAPDLLQQWAPLFAIAVGCNNAGRRHDPNGSGTTCVGDPTEIALLQFADAVLPNGPSVSPRVGECPFDADRRRMATIHATASGGQVVYVKRRRSGGGSADLHYPTPFPLPPPSSPSFLPFCFSSPLLFWTPSPRGEPYRGRSCDRFESTSNLLADSEYRPRLAGLGVLPVAGDTSPSWAVVPANIFSTRRATVRRPDVRLAAIVPALSTRIELRRSPPVGRDAVLAGHGSQQSRCRIPDRPGVDCCIAAEGALRRDRLHSVLRTKKGDGAKWLPPMMAGWSSPAPASSIAISAAPPPRTCVLARWRFQQFGGTWLVERPLPPRLRNLVADSGSLQHGGQPILHGRPSPATSILSGRQKTSESRNSSATRARHSSALS